MIPIIPGILPFGLIMGSVAVNANLSNLQTTGLNTVIFAGASQLASVDLLSQSASSIIIILTGIIINMRFVLYSAAFAPILKNTSFLTKSIAAYLLTDQSYAVSVSKDSEFSSNNERVAFFFGNSICMAIAWHGSVILGVLFGNFAPDSLSLDFAVPLSFIALTIPTLKSKAHVSVALCSLILSCALFHIPFNLGLLITGTISIALAVYMTRRKNE